MEEMCKVCNYFMPVVEVKKGRCRRWPPTINTAWTGSNPLGFYTNYPAVHDDQWCGEFSEAPPEPS
ncbi:MAG: hypothetical protein VCD31_08350 [Alphaproteobacteria bacterium]